VSHPSRQQSGGVRTRTSGGEEAAMCAAAISSIDLVLCDDASGASSDPGLGTVPGARASSGGVLVW
jgi:hypothetical protein